jgi:hypothetical protein
MNTLRRRLDIFRLKRLWPGVWLAMSAASLLIYALVDWRTRAAIQDLIVTASFAAEESVVPGEQIELRRSRSLQPSKAG